MSYKPKYCCQCGEKIDRINWKPWTSRRFCELCETDFIVYDWLTRVLVGIGLLLGLYGIGSFFQKPEKHLSLAPNQFASGTTNSKSEIDNQKTASQVPTSTGVQTLLQTNNSASQIKSQAVQRASDLKSKPLETSPNASPETIYFCGAQTKKGTLCSRRVKGGRCWQHTGQMAKLPQAELIASQ